MPETPIPWVGLAALIAMFVIPFLPRWLFEGPRKVKHWPQQHMCAVCDAPWTDGHSCSEEVVVVERASAAIEPAPPLRGELRRSRTTTTRELERPSEARIS
jgi:hypothetical protein